MKRVNSITLSKSKRKRAKLENKKEYEQVQAKHTAKNVRKKMRAKQLRVSTKEKEGKVFKVLAKDYQKAYFLMGGWRPIK